MQELSRHPDEPLAAWRARVVRMNTTGWSRYHPQARTIVLDAILLAMRSEVEVRGAE